MSVVVRQQRTSRLARMIDEAGGVSVGVALTQARANLEAKRSTAKATVSRHIEELAALQPPSAGDACAQLRLSQAYALSSAVIDAAGPFEMEDLCTVASGLCDLIDAAGEGPFDWRLVQVHAQSMQLILSLPVEQQQARSQVLDSLKLILVKKLPPAVAA